MLIDIDEVKLFNQISGDSKDALIEALIYEVEDEIKAFCNSSFQDSTGCDTWPSGMKLIASDMIYYRLDKGRDMKSETQGGYSFTRQDIGESGYPVSIEKRLSKFRVLSVKYTQPKSQFRDKRGQSLGETAEGKYAYGEEGTIL